MPEMMEYEAEISATAAQEIFDGHQSRRTGAVGWKPAYEQLRTKGDKSGGTAGGLSG
jgi:hypothetical protein